MTREDIIKMAREAGCLGPGAGGDPNGLWEPCGHENVTDLMIRFANLVAAAEREECAQICEVRADEEIGMAYQGIALDCADAIRARGEK